MADKEALNQQILDTIHTMRLEGLIDEHFTFVYSLKENSGDPFYLSNLISQFCSDARDVLRDLNQQQKEDVLNYNVMKEYVYKVKGSSLSLGARRMATAFTNFERAIYKESRDGCQMALNEAQQQYSNLEAKLHVILQLERRIVLLSVQGNNP